MALAEHHLHETHRIAYDGAVDADGHILEPPDLWETYLEPKYRDRALRIVRDADGLEELELDGRRSEMSRKGSVSTLGAMGAPNLTHIARDPERTYLREAPYGSMDPDQRIELLDAENLDAVILYTTVGLLWEAEVTDPELSQAYTRAYNRWICEFAASSPRLIPTAHVSLTDPVAAAAEIHRAVREGARGAYVCPFTHDAKPLGHPDHDPVFRACSDEGIPFAIHPTFEPQWTKNGRLGRWEDVKQLQLTAAISASDGVRTQFATLFDYAVFERFPELKVLVLESGAGWLGYWLDRMDGVFQHTAMAHRVGLKELPSHYFRTQCWISADPDERMIPALAERYGWDRFLWASDFPHPDHTPGYVLDLNELAGMFPDEHRRAFLGDNARALFGIADA